MKKEDIIEIEMEQGKDGTFLPVRQYTLAQKEKKEKKIRRIKQQNERHINVLNNSSSVNSVQFTVNQFLEGLTIGLNVLQKFQRMIR